ncbi:MAG: hypothetical protein PHY93_18890 [Bacteriovorax sp.]|nr:hypothetical protein [Bacteriovorax sp.]
MKNKEIEFKTKCIKYSDLSSDNDHQLQLISSLLLKVDDVLEIKEAKTLGYYLDSYLNKKIIIDHCFWDRGVELCNLDDEEIESLIIEVRNRSID